MSAPQGSSISLRTRTVITAAIGCGLLLAPGDGVAQRKGFVLNLGIGGGQFSAGAAEGGPRESVTGVTTDFKIGHAFSDQFMLYYSNDAAFFSDPFLDEGLLNVSGLSGIGVTWFLRPAAPSLYVGGGIGISVWAVLEESGDSDAISGVGFAFNGGYEFARHFMIDADIILGRPGDEFGRLGTRTIRLAINWLLY